MRNQREFITSAKSSGERFTCDKEFTIILFPESHGYRIKNYGAVQFTKINGVSLLDRQIKSLKDTFLNFNLILCCGFETSKIWKHVKKNYSSLDVKIVENPLYRTTNSCESIRLALMQTNLKNVLISSCYNLFEKKHLDQLSYNNNSTLFQKIKNNKTDLKVYKDEKNYVKIDFGIGDLSWVEILYLHGEKSVNEFYSIVDSEDYKNKFLFEAINKFCSKTTMNIVENKYKTIIKIDSTSKLKEINQ